MKTIKGLLAWTNGKKTVVGGLILLFVLVVPQVEAIIGVQLIDPATLATMQKVGEAITAIGVVHKAQKVL